MATHIHIHVSARDSAAPPQWNKFQQYMKKAWAAERGKESAQKRMAQGKPPGTKSPQEFSLIISENFNQANMLLAQMNKDYPEFTNGFPSHASATGWLRLIK